MNSFLFALWFFLPAGLANASPVFFNKIPWVNQWDTPLDFGKTYRGKRIFGDNKKWRGLIGGILVATITVYFQHKLATGSSVPIGLGISQITGEVNYFDSQILWLGPLLGFGALLGDAAESFVKRLIGKNPGETWFPFDQIDYIIGGLIFSLPIVVLPLTTYFLLLATWFFMHLISSYIGWLLKLKAKPI